MKFFRCLYCEVPLRSPKTLLCQTCIGHLIPSPPLCSLCATSHCSPQHCQYPWLHTLRTPISTFDAAFLCAGPSYEILKKWKKQQGSLFNLNWLFEITQKPLKFNPTIHSIVPIPQRIERSWMLQANPSFEIAYTISKRIQKPLLNCLKQIRTGPRQAERALEERLSLDQNLFSCSHILQNQVVLLVDDFFTTGRTVQAAAVALKKSGAHEIHVFCLGLRARMMHQSGVSEGCDTRKLAENSTQTITIG